MRPFLVECIKPFTGPVLETFFQRLGRDINQAPQLNEIYIVQEVKHCSCGGKHLIFSLTEISFGWWDAEHFRELKPLDIDNIIEEGRVGIDWEAGRLVDLKEFEKAYNTRG